MPPQIISVIPGEDFSVDFNLDPDRVKALKLAPDSGEEVHDVVRLEVEGTPIIGEVRVITAYAGVGGDEQPAVLPGENGKFVPAYVLDVRLQHLPSGIKDNTVFNITLPLAGTLSVKVIYSYFPGPAEGETETMLNYWGEPGRDKAVNPVFSQHNLSQISYRLELPQQASPSPAA